MKELVVDVETTTYNKGNPFDTRNICVLCATYDGRDTHIFVTTDANGVASLFRYLDQYDVLIGHNFKFDLHLLLNLQ